ncbi:DUF202 domain-containing protein [Nocardioides ferulae]|uniref:DUF202 domain-containing protein n=1 Tax=Nocardioides ferulae TaxID=2340821 RepID=UPI000EAC738E|nr:hypothetical protein [Nocardioides ferulae]
MSRVAREAGLAPERTQLAELRTALSLAVALLALARLTADRIGPVVWAAALAGLFALAVVSGGRKRVGVGARVGVIVAVVLLLGVVELAAIVAEVV